MDRRSVNLVLVGSLATALAALAIPASAASTQKCYGYDGQSFKLVPKGTCTAMRTPFGPGSLKPIKRPT
jgi:uncharacterized membrane protein